MTADPRVTLGRNVTTAGTGEVLEALDRRRVVVRAPTHAAPQEALTAAALLVLVTRGHAHVELDTDGPLPPNPWGANTLGDLHRALGPVRPFASADAASTVVVDVGRSAARSGVVRGLRVAAQPWTAAVTGGGPLPAPDAVPRNGGTVSAYGGLVGAGLAAARLFREALRPLGLPAPDQEPDVVWNLVDHRRIAAPIDLLTNPRPGRWPAVAWLACGSVGSSAAAVLACEDLTGLHAETVDGDTFDTARNTFRYPASLGHDPGPKAEWTAQLLRAAGADARPHTGSIRDWVLARPEPGWDGIALSSVDTVDGRYDAADVLARTTVSAAVAGLALHMQREHLGDGLRCPYCDFVDLKPALSQAAEDAALTGLSESRIVALLDGRDGLTSADIDVLLTGGRIDPQDAAGLVGRRVADLRPRVYAQGVVQVAGAQPVPVSAPFVSWVTGALCAAEIGKAARGLPLVHRRVELDLHGTPDDFVHRLPADRSGRCPCASNTRRRWMTRLYGPPAPAQAS